LRCWFYDPLTDTLEKVQTKKRVVGLTTRFLFMGFRLKSHASSELGIAPTNTSSQQTISQFSFPAASQAWIFGYRINEVVKSGKEVFQEEVYGNGQSKPASQ
jgi:hypothetical protein